MADAKQRRKIKRVKNRDREWIKSGKVPICLVRCLGLFTLFGEEGYYVPARKTLFGQPLDKTQFKAYHHVRKEFVWLQACTPEEAAEILLVELAAQSEVDKQLSDLPF